jgi:hypothetical protein
MEQRRPDHLGMRNDRNAAARVLPPQLLEMRHDSVLKLFHALAVRRATD